MEKNKDIIETIFVDYNNYLLDIKGNLYKLGESNENPDLAGYLIGEISKVEQILDEAKYNVVNAKNDDVYNENIYNDINYASEKLETTIGDLYDETKKDIGEKYDEQLYNMCSVAIGINNFKSSYIDYVSTIPNSEKDVLKIKFEEKNIAINNLQKELVAKKENSQKK